MPIRMVEDENNDSPDNSGGRSEPGNGGGGGGGRGIGGGIIGMLLPLLMRNPKLLIIVVILGGAYMMFGGGCGGAASLLNQQNEEQTTLNKGATLDPKEFDRAEVFEPLSAEGNTMPERVSLEQYAPQRKNQGQQGSCVGWGSAYAAHSILQSIATNQNPDQAAFSPAFLYNQIGLEGCQGSYIFRAMENMSKVGSLPNSQFTYDENDCSRKPSQMQLSQASQFKLKGANRLTKNGDDQTIDMLAMKQNLAQGAPVVIGMMVGGSFMQGMMGNKVWVPDAGDYDMQGFGGHCMCVIGYDDYLEGGAFQIMNSWGPEWGENGLGWVRYKDFQYFTKEAYGTYPMGNANNTNKQQQLQLGLLNTATKQLIPFKNGNETNLFETVGAIRKGDKFKIQVSNTADCYTYVFGQETDGSSYILFPYTPKHSPYCGIVGTRLFPKDYSMQADDKGNKDYMAVVITKTPIDFKKLNDAINTSKKSTYSAKINEVLANQLGSARYQVNNTINIDAGTDTQKTLAFVMAINKN